MTAVGRLTRLVAALSKAAQEDAAQEDAAQEDESDGGINANRLSSAIHLHPQTWSRSLTSSLEGWRRDPDRLADAEETLKAPALRGALPSILVITPSDTPAPLLNATIASCALDRPIVLRPSHQHRVFASLWLDRLNQATPAPIRLDDAACPKDFQRVIAYGADETMANLSKESANGAFHGHGERTSLAYVECEDAGESARIAVLAAIRDIVVWDGRGCLTPSTVFVAGDAASFADVLARMLQDAERESPRELPPPGVSLALHAARSDCKMRGGRVLGSPQSTAWTVLHEPAAAPDEAAAAHDAVLGAALGWRLVRVKSILSWEAFRTAWTPNASRIESIGLAIADERILAARLNELGPRGEILGRMQSPSLARSQSGQPSLLELLSTVCG